MILGLDEKAVLLCQWLASCLISYSKVLEALSTVTPQSELEGQLRSMIFQVFYLLVDVLERLANKEEHDQETETENG